ncbi:MAG: HAD family hydrolase [Lachnospiraceae bacterium]
MNKGIIFDLDGTLWDAVEEITQSWNLELEEHSQITTRITKEEMQAYMGKTMDKFTALFPEIEQEEAIELLERCCIRENSYLEIHPGRLYPRELETLTQLKENNPLFIVSNCHSGYIEAYQQAYHLKELFQDIECFGSTGKQKAENIRIVMERNHITEAIYIGDTQGDYQAAKEAGVKFIHAAYGFGKVPEAEESVGSIEELIHIL